MTKRAVAFYAVLLLIFCGLIANFLTLSDNRATTVLSGQSAATVTVATVRGTIYDREFRPMVNDAVETRLCVAPYPRTLAALADLLPDDVFQSLSDRLKSGYPTVAVLDQEIPLTTEGVLTFDVPTRNGGALFAPHLVGYTANDGSGGITGIEAAYDDYLRACEGKLTVSYDINAAGGLLPESTPRVQDTTGNAHAGVVLTIDREIQNYAESVAKSYLKKGAIIISDAESCEVLASVSTPSFQPDTVADLLEDPDTALLDRTLCNYNCGSVFKIVSAAAALEQGISTERVYTCTGSCTVDGVTFHCHNRLGHGRLTMTEAFAASCNCYFIQLMQDAGGEALYKMATALGFDRSILLAENYKTARATIPTLQELTSSRAALANLSFGQGSLLATPYHMAQLVGAVLHGGEMIRPSAVRGTVDAGGYFVAASKAPAQTAFSEKTAEILRSMMIAAVGEHATGSAANPKNGGAGGKTGTAETGWVTENGKTVQGWFAGFYPADSPRYIVVVLAEDSGTTGVSAASVFHRLCDGLYTF